MSKHLKTYRKKPLEVRAILLRDTGRSMMRELEDAGIDWKVYHTAAIEIYNPGTQWWLRVNPGDYIILAPTGCRYPVKPDQFERNYEAIADGVPA